MNDQDQSLNPQHWTDWSAEAFDAMDTAALEWSGGDIGLVQQWARLQIVGLLDRCRRLSADLDVAQSNLRYRQDGGELEDMRRRFLEANAASLKWERRAREAEARLQGIADSDLMGIRVQSVSGRASLNAEEKR